MIMPFWMLKNIDVKKKIINHMYQNIYIRNKIKKTADIDSRSNVHYPPILVEFDWMPSIEICFGLLFIYRTS